MEWALAPPGVVCWSSSGVSLGVTPGSVASTGAGVPGYVTPPPPSVDVVSVYQPDSATLPSLVVVVLASAVQVVGVPAGWHTLGVANHVNSAGYYVDSVAVWMDTGDDISADSLVIPADSGGIITGQGGSVTAGTYVIAGPP